MMASHLRLLVGLLVLPALAAAADNDPAPDRIRAHAEALLAIPEREMGSPGAAKAADYIERSLRASGFDEVLRQRTTVTVPVARDCVLEVGARRFTLRAHVPNGAELPKTGPEGIAGPVIDAGRGTPAELRGKRFEGAIVLLDGDSEKAWLQCAALGARAIVFRHPERIDARQLRHQYLTASVDLPRFVADLPDGLDGQQGVLRASAAMERRQADTLLVRVKGTAKTDAVILAAGYEAAGVLPGHDPGATRAWNAALLLELARQLRAKPPRRDVLIAFHGARAEAFRGLRQLVGCLFDPIERAEYDASLGWQDAPLADREAVRLVYEDWRASLVEADFRAFLELGAGFDRRLDELGFLRVGRGAVDEHVLIRLLERIDYVPESRGLFAGLDYPPANAPPAPADAAGGTTAEAAAEQPATDIAWIVRVVVASVLALGAIALIALRVRVGKPSWVLVSTVCLIVFFVDKALLAPSEEKSETDTGQEAQLVRDMGIRFVAEEAARRADDLQPVIEDLRKIRSLQEKVATLRKDGKEPPRRDLLEIDAAKARIAALTGEQLDVAQLDEQIERYDDQHQTWRNIQQKLGKRDLDAETELPRLAELIRAVVEGDGDTTSNLDRHRIILAERLDDLRSSIALRKRLTEMTGAAQAPRLLLAFDFSDGNRHFSSIGHGNLVRWQDKLKVFNQGMKRLAQRLNEEELGGALAFDPTPYDLSDDPAAWWPQNYAHASEFLGLHMNAITLSTVNDARLKVGTPQDSAAAFRGDNFLRQTKGLTLFVREVLDGGLAENSKAQAIALKVPTIRVKTRSEGDATGRKGFPYPYVAIVMGTDAAWRGDVRTVQTHWGDAFGELRIPWTPEKINGFGGTFPVHIYGYGEHARLRDIVVSKGPQKTAGIDNSALRVGAGGVRDLLVQVFRFEPSYVYDVFDPRLLKQLREVNVLSASRDAAPNYAHVEQDAAVAACFAPPGTALRVIASQGQVGKRMLLLGDYLGKQEFLGLKPGHVIATEDFEGDGERRPVPTSYAQSQDTLDISKARLDKLQENGVNSETDWTLLAAGQQRVEAAREALLSGDFERAEGLSKGAWSYLSRVYPSVVATANDVVYGLVLMLLLAIPFAVVCERLFVSAKTIFGKIGGFSLFFVITFLFFLFFHPAFSLATTPVIIFLAFAIIVMSVFVIGIIYNRFEYEMELIRMSGLGMHKADVSRLGTLLATGQLGISNMRRRPLRTFLTAITVVLMTFILLTFASFNSSAGTRSIGVDIAPSYTGVLVRMPGWHPFEEGAYERVRQTWGDRFQIHRRLWIMSEGSQTKMPLNGPKGPSYVEGVVGVAPGDPSGVDQALVRLDAKGAKVRGIDPEGRWVFLPQVVLDQSGYALGDTLLYNGMEMRAGLIDADALLTVHHLDGDPFTPLSPAGMSEEQKRQRQEQADSSATGEAPQETMSFTHLGPDSVAFTHRDVVQRLGGKLRSMALVPWSESEAADLARQGVTVVPASELDFEQTTADMAQQLALNLRVGHRGSTYLLTGVGKLSVAGLGDVLIPLILGGMIIFSTMLGSVAERGKEIFIYASLGLAPIHIAALFLVEAAIYAILGGLGGYITAQALASLLGFLASFGIGVQPDINYSSFTAVMTILLVMATVLLSALYPAMVASKAANPGDDNQFRVPEPDGDHMEIVFPFTVARRDVRGLLAFLKTYFDANTEASTGCFTAADARMEIGDNAFSVYARTWLAPFDLGISQDFRMVARPTDVKAIYSINIGLDLLSGQRSAWRRALSAFLKDMRKQFLVWRTLDDETTDRYRAEGGDEDARRRVEERKLRKAEAAAEPEAAEAAPEEAAVAAAETASDDAAGGGRP